MLEQPNTILDGGLVSKLRAEIEDLFIVQEVAVPKDQPQGTIIFLGYLLMADSESVYDTIAQRWIPHQYTPILSRLNDQIALTAQPGLIKPNPSNPIINLVLFIVTLLSVLFVGAANEGVNPLEDISQLSQGLPFAIAFLAILSAHEFGHYFAARYHKVAVTLPYFIPFPTIWGTMGAFIQLRSPTKTRRELFDVGVAGPLAGLAVAIPVLIYGLSTSVVEALPPEPYMLEGNSIFYWLTKYLIFGQALPANGIDVSLNSIAWAGWSGLFITVVNLLPVGQLDGGHVTYVLFGRVARKIGYVIIGLMLCISFILWLTNLSFWQGWLFWVLLIGLFIGVGHPPPLNDLAPIGTKRTLLGYLMIVIFILLFMPVPLTLVGM